MEYLTPKDNRVEIKYSSWKGGMIEKYFSWGFYDFYPRKTRVKRISSIKA